MGVLEIIVIIVGITVFIGSFFLPDQNKGVEISIPDEIIREIIEKETKKAVIAAEEQIDEKITEIQGTTERKMERLSNEKIMAIDEFSDTVLQKIYKNHEEAVFLYDMLNNKHIQIKNTMAEIEGTLKERKGENQIKNILQEDSGSIEGKTEEVLKKHALLDEISTGIGSNIEKQLSVEENDPNSLRESNEEIQEEKTADDKNRILDLYKIGKSEVEIAKILGMGIGEVKLIIGLYKEN